MNAHVSASPLLIIPYVIRTVIVPHVYVEVCSGSKNRLDGVKAN